MIAPIDIACPGCGTAAGSYCGTVKLGKLGTLRDPLGRLIRFVTEQNTYCAERIDAALRKAES